MNELWYNKISVLLEKPLEFIPSDKLEKNENINALARLGFYMSILIIVFKFNNKLLAISVTIIIISLFLAYTEKFESVEDKTCFKPTKNNPFMNYTLGDLISDKDRPKACPYEKVKKDVKKNFTSSIISDYSNLWGKFIWDRNFYTMPNTDIVNDQTGFALWCYNNKENCNDSYFSCEK